MELKSPKTKKKSNISKLISWGKMVRIPLLIMFLLGSTNCDDDSAEMTDYVPSSNLKINFFETNARHRHSRVQPSANDSVSNNEKLSEIRYLRRHLNKNIVNFVMTDFLVDGEVENRVHYNGVTAKETFAGDDGDRRTGTYLAQRISIAIQRGNAASLLGTLPRDTDLGQIFYLPGLRLRQLTDGRHFVQIIYSANGVIQDCDYIPRGKSARNFLKTIRKELKQGLDEEHYRLMSNMSEDIDNEKYLRHFHNASFRALKKGEHLPKEIASWFNYDKLKMECLRRHEELKYITQSKHFDGHYSVNRLRRSFKELFILPGTKWCGAGQLAEEFQQLGEERKEDQCCRAHDTCPINIGAFKRRFGYFNHRLHTISHCRCDRRFRACLKLADTSVSNMVGKVFFNIVQSKCFVLKRVKMCTQRSWWGRCLMHDNIKQAFIRNNLPY